MKNYLILFLSYLYLTSGISQPVELNALIFEETQNIREISNLIYWTSEGPASSYFFEGLYNLAKQELEQKE